MLKKTLVAAVIMAGLSNPALAQDAAGDGWYVGLRTGVADLNNPDFTLSDPSAGDRLDTVLKTDSGWALSGEGGYKFGNLRAGVELSYQKNDVKGLDLRSLNGTTITAGDVADLVDALVANEVIDPDALDGGVITGTTINGKVGKLEQVALMANLTYVFSAGDKFKPYVGAGIGGVATHADLLGEDDGVVSFAWQLRAGGAWKVSDRVDLTADYTYRQAAAGNLSFGDTDLDLRLGKTTASLFMVGMHYGF